MAEICGLLVHFYLPLLERIIRKNANARRMRQNGKPREIALTNPNVAPTSQSYTRLTLPPWQLELCLDQVSCWRGNLFMCIFFAYREVYLLYLWLEENPLM